MSTDCPMAVAFTTDGKPALLFCGKWDCQHCRPFNAGKWAQVGKFAVAYGQAGRLPVSFWTFTLGSKYKSTADGYKALPRLWDNLRKTLQRYYGKFDYMAVVEEQPKKRKMPHFHVLAFCAIPAGYSKRRDPNKWIKDFGVKMGFGHQCEQKPVDDHLVVVYLVKYLSKDGQGMPANFRRMRLSHTFPRPPEQARQPYIVRSFGELIQDYLLRVADTTGRAIDDLYTDYNGANAVVNSERALSEWLSTQTN